MTPLDPPSSDAEGDNRDRGVSILRLALVSLITLALILLAIFNAQPVPVPVLSVWSETHQVNLEWTLTDSDFDGHFQYQHRSPTGDYPRAWTTMSAASKHIVTGLKDGRVYVFRLRAVSSSGIAGSPSNEVSVVPLGRPDDRLAGLETGLTTLETEVTALRARVEGIADSLNRSDDHFGRLETGLTTLETDVAALRAKVDSIVAPPDSPGPRNEGLDEPQPRPTGLEARVTALEDGDSCAKGILGEVRFRHRSATLFPSEDPSLTTRNQASLRTIAEQLRAAGTGRLAVVTGHASAPGRASRNLDLSESRANAVILYLSQGSQAWNGELIARAEGEWRPAIPGRQQSEDRRAVVALCSPRN